MTTYKKPLNATSLLPAGGRTYHDFEMESGINKKVNCLTALTVVALVVALAGLSLSIMLLFKVPITSTLIPQEFQTTGMEISTLEVLQNRVKVLEDQVGIDSSFQSVVVDRQETSNGQSAIPSENDPPLDPPNPVIIEFKGNDFDSVFKSVEDTVLGSTMSSRRHPAITKEEDNVDRLYPVNVYEEDNDDREEDEGMVRCAPLGDDDEDHYGSGDYTSLEDCPQYPRPACPKGYSICYEGEGCPIPKCRKRK